MRTRTLSNSSSCHLKTEQPPRTAVVISCPTLYGCQQKHCALPARVLPAQVAAYPALEANHLALEVLVAVLVEPAPPLGLQPADATHSTQIPHANHIAPRHKLRTVLVRGLKVLNTVCSHQGAHLQGTKSCSLGAILALNVVHPICLLEHHRPTPQLQELLSRRLSLGRYRVNAQC